MWETLRCNKLFIAVSTCLFVYFFLAYLAPVIAPILISMLFVTIFGPTLQRLQSKLHINRQVGALFLLLIFCAFLALILWILFSWIVGSLPTWVERMDQFQKQLAGAVHEASDWISKRLKVDGAHLEYTILLRIDEGMDSFRDISVPGVISQSFTYVKNFIHFGAFFITFIISTVLLAKDYDKIMNRLLDHEECHVLLEVICGVIRYIATYVKAQFLIMVSVAAIASVTLSVCGIKQGALFGLAAGVLDALPFFGTSIVLLPLAISQVIYGSYAQSIFCLLVYIACTLLREFMEPRLIGSQMGIPAIAILLSVYAGVQLFGLSGIIKGPLGFMVIYQTYQSLTKRTSRNDLSKN